MKSSTQMNIDEITLETVFRPNYKLSDVIIPDAWLNVPEPVIEAFYKDMIHQDIVVDIIMKLNDKVNKINDAVKTNKTVANKDMIENKLLVREELIKLIKMT